MPDGPEFVVAPPPRCFYHYDDPPGVFCGRIASWKREGGVLFGVQYFCDAHRAAIDVAIAGQRVMNRVRVSVVVDLAGVSFSSADARHEAVCLVERTMTAAGAVCSVLQVSSAIGYHVPQPAPDGERKRMAKAR